MKIFKILFVVTYMVSLASLVSAQELLIHEVKDGDTLWDISDKYYKTPWLWMAIADYNKLKNPHYLAPYDKIKIPEVPQVKVTAVFGNVTIKRIGTDKYVNLREGDLVYPHDEVVVGADSTAQLEFEDKSVLQLKPETSLILKHSVFAEKVKAVKTKVKLLRGKMLFKGTRTTGSNFEIETPGVFCGVRGTEFQLEYTPEGVSSISVFEGEVQASSAGKDINIPAGCGSQIVKGEPPAAPKPLPNPPELITPVDGHVTGILTPSFEWKSVPEAAKYHFELSKDAAFNNVVYKVKGTEATGVVARTLQVGRYYWHVSSIDKSGLEGKFSKAKILTVVRKLQVELVPDGPSYKKDEVIYTSLFCKYALNPSDVDTSIVRIMVAVDNEDFFAYHWPISLEKAGKHTIKYKGVDVFDNHGKIDKFDVMVDNTPPKIKIEIDRCVQLKSGSFVLPETKFSLITIDDASGVNEVLYRIDNEEWKEYRGPFSILQEGRHQIEFRAKDNVGNQSKEKVIDVIVDFTPPEIKIEMDRKSGCFVHPQTKFSLIAADFASGVDEVLCKIDNEGWKRYTGTFSISLEGRHQIGFRAKDSVGNQSQEKVLDVIVDRTPPEIKIEVDRKSGCFVHPQTRFSLIAADFASGVDEVLYKIDNEEWKIYTGIFSIFLEGRHQIRFQAKDNIGNQSKEQVLDVIVDSTPPEIKIEMDRKSGCFVHPQTKFSLIAGDNASGLDEVLCKIDNEEWKRYSGTFSISQEGRHQIGFRAKDNLGNQSKEETIDVVVDNTPPMIKLEIDRCVQLKSGCFVLPETKFSLITIDDASGVDKVFCRIDTEEWKEYRETFSILQEGSHQIGFRAKDNVGNQSKEQVFDVIVDFTPPEIKIETNRKSGDFVHPQTKFSLIAADFASGVDEVLCKIDNEEWKRYSGAFSISQEGNHQIGFRAKDNVGNQSKEQVLEVIVDFTPPEIKIEIDRKSGCFVHPQTRFSLIAADFASGVDEVLCKIDNEEWKRYSGTFSISQEGNHPIGFRAKDNVGNQSKEQVLDVIVDFTPPEIKIEIDRKSGGFVHPQTRFSLIAGDNASGLDEVLCKIDNEEWKRYSGTFSISQEGRHQIGFQAKDNIGNQSKEEFIDIVVDNTPPGIKLEIDRCVKLDSGCFVLPKTKFSLTTTDDTSGVNQILCRIDTEEWKEYRGPFSIFQEGSHQIGFRAKDNIGNQSKEEMIDVVVDNTAPKIKLEIDRCAKLESGCFVLPETKFSLITTDDASGVAEVLCRIDNEEWKEYKGTFSILQEGRHQIGFRAKDNIGHQSKEEGIDVVVDNTAPKIKIEIDRCVKLETGCFVLPETKFSLITTDDASGVAEVLCRIDNEEWKEYKGPFSILQEGRHQIGFQAKDNIGHQSKEEMIDVVVDNTPPKIKLEIDRCVKLESGCFVLPETKFSLTTTDETSGVNQVLCRIDEEEWKEYRGPFSILQEGCHQIGFRAKDNIGHQSKEEMIDVVVDNTPPKIKIEIDKCVQLKSGYFVLPETKFSLITTDDASGMGQILYRIDNEEWKEYRGPFSILQEGRHQIGFRAKDNIGNQSKEEGIDIVVDNTAPKIKMEVDKYVQLKSGCFVLSETKFSLITTDDDAGVNEVFYKIDNEEWKKYRGPFSIIQEGRHQIKFHARDNIGNQSKEEEIDVVVDNTPPKIKTEIDKYVQLESGSFVRSETKFSLITIDDASGVNEVLCRIDNEEWKKYRGPFSIIQEGRHQIGFRAKDNIGNQSKEERINIVVDNTPPGIKMEIDRCVQLESGCFVLPQTKFSLITTDDASGVGEVLCRIDKKWKEYTGSFSILQEGCHQIGFRARDNAGNQSKEEIIDVVVDWTPPKIKLDIDRCLPSKSGYFVRSEAKFSLLTLDDASGVNEVLCRIDNEDWKGYRGTFSILQEGNHQIGFRAKDNIGNQSKEEGIDVVVDNTAPGIKIEIDKYVQLESGCFVLPVTKFSLITIDDTSGVAEILCRIDNKEWKKYTGPFSILQEGRHQIRFQAKDNAGNHSKEEMIDIVVDNTPPKIKLDIDRCVKLKSGWFVLPETKFSLITTDDVSGVNKVLCRIDNAEWKEYREPFSILEEGSHQIRFRARDNIGNQSKEEGIDVVVDNTPPKIKLDIDRCVELKSGCFVRSETKFSLITTDDASGVAEVLYRIDTEEWKEYRGPFSILQEGGHQIGFHAKDNIGNQSEEEIINVVVDNTPPKIKTNTNRW